jgi:hypothetical protein
MTLAEVIEKFGDRNPLSPVLRGEGRGEGLSGIESLCHCVIESLEGPLTPTLSPEYRGEGGMRPAVTGCLRRRADEAAEIEDICRQTLPLLEEIRDHVADQPRVNRCISAVDALRARMNGLGATYDLVTQLTQSTELQRFKADRQIGAAQALDGNERQRRQVVRDIDNVRAIADAARDFQHLMRQTVEALELPAEAGRPAVRSDDAMQREAA